MFLQTATLVPDFVGAYAPLTRRRCELVRSRCVSFLEPALSQNVMPPNDCSRAAWTAARSVQPRGWPVEGPAVDEAAGGEALPGDGP